MSGRETLAIPSDFPRRPGAANEEAFTDWQICDEVVSHLISECTKEQETKPALPTVEVLDIKYQEACGLGWGTPSELAWVFLRAAAKLGCGVPESLRLK